MCKLCRSNEHFSSLARKLVLLLSRSGWMKFSSHRRGYVILRLNNGLKQIIFEKVKKRNQTTENPMKSISPSRHRVKMKLRILIIFIVFKSFSASLRSILCSIIHDVTSKILIKMHFSTDATWTTFRIRCKSSLD